MRYTYMLLISSTLTLAVFFVLTAFANTTNAMIFPGENWVEATPESQGVDSVTLNEAMNYLAGAAGGCGASEAVVIRNGYMIWKGADIAARHSVDSVTKTFSTTVLGLLVDDGLVSLDAHAADHLPGLDEDYPVYAGIKFRHLASMTSGYDGERGETTPEQPWGDPTQYLIPTAPLFDPGTEFKYHDPAVHQMGRILTGIASEPFESLFKRRVADPIGMSNWIWHDTQVVDGIVLNNPSGIYDGGMHITAPDLARHGLLYLCRGNWNGRQLLSSTWVEQATSNQVPSSLPYNNFDRTGRFGFMWWTNGMDREGNRPWPAAPIGTYTALGGFRNYCFIIPEWDMVIVRMEDHVEISNSDQVWNHFFSILAPGVSILPCEGDFDGDGGVDGADLAVFAAEFGRTNCCEPDTEKCAGDFDADCDVDGGDLSVFAADFGRSDCPLIE